MRVYADDEFNESPMMVDDPELQEAIDLINDYCLAEFDHMGITDGDNLEDVGLMYTTDEDVTEDGSNYMVELQVSADLINKAINYYVNGDLRHQDKFGSYAELTAALEYLDFDSMYGSCLDYVTDQDREDSVY